MPYLKVIQRRMIHFSIYVNDLPKSTSLFNILVYADDTTLNCDINKIHIEDRSFMLNYELNRIHSCIRFSS